MRPAGIKQKRIQCKTEHIGALSFKKWDVFQTESEQPCITKGQQFRLYSGRHIMPVGKDQGLSNEHKLNYKHK